MSFRVRADRMVSPGAGAVRVRPEVVMDRVHGPLRRLQSPGAPRPYFGEARPPAGNHVARTLILELRDPEERRAALLEDGRLSLLWVERDDDRSLVGNIYKGKVLRVEPSIGAAFVDLGIDRPGFLPADDAFTVLNGEAPPETPVPATGDVAPDLPPDALAGAAPTTAGDGAPAEAAAASAAAAAEPAAAPEFPPRPPAPPIDELFKAGEPVVVQVARDAIGRKGPTLTTHISFPGRTLVLFPSLGRRAVSRKIEDPEARKRIQGTLEQLGFPEGVGVVARTAFLDADPAEVEAEAARLIRAHRAVADTAPAADAPSLLHEEADFVTRAVRELAIRAPEGSALPLKVIADTEEAVARARTALGVGASVEVEFHSSPVPIFHALGIERAVRELDDPRVTLPGGASLVIDETEAMWTIDVNSGRLRTGASIEATALETDLLAAKEAARQIRLRDLSGLIAVDFIDCREAANRQKVEDTFRAELAKDPARLRAAALSEFMTVEITRRRLRSGAARSGAVPCPSCRGRGRIHSAAAAGLRALRDLRNLTATGPQRQVEVRCSQEIANDLQRRQADLDRLRGGGARIDVAVVPASPADWFEVRRK